MPTSSLILAGPPRREIRIERQVIEVTSGLPTTDPEWKFTDAQGHKHYHSSEVEPYPTLKWVFEGEPYWCDDCEDEHQDGHYECVLCGEEIRPGLRVPGYRQFVQGLTSYFIDDEPATLEECNALIEAEKARRR